MSRAVNGDNRTNRNSGDTGDVESLFSPTFGVEGSALDDPNIITDAHLRQGPTRQEREDRKMRRARLHAQRQVEGQGAVNEARRYLARKRHALDLSPEEKITQAAGWFCAALLLLCVALPLLRQAWPHVGEAVASLTRAWKGQG